MSRKIEKPSKAATRNTRATGIAILVPPGPAATDPENSSVLTPEAMPSWVVHTPRRSGPSPKPALGKTTAPRNAPASASASTGTKAVVSVQAEPQIGVLPGAVRSSISGVAWPGLPASDQQLIQMAVQFQLEQSQWWTAERIRQHQYQQLRLLLQHAAATIPYYRDLFKRIGIDPTQNLTPETWGRIPTLSRRNLQENFKALKSAAVPTGHGKVRSFDTSGSTGAPVVVLKTDLQHVFWQANTLRDHLWHRRDMAASLAAIKIFDRASDATYPDGARGLGWSDATAMFAGGPGFALNLATKVHNQIEWLRRIQPTYLMTPPSNLAALARHCLDHKISMPFLRQLRTISETLRPEVRDICREAWKVEIVDTYSTEEVGIIAVQSPVSHELIVHAETNLVEIIDEQGMPCAPGTVGRVIVTPLHAYAMPLLRYEIGDLAEAGGQAACGRGLPVIARILGRERSMVRLPNGQRHYPSFHYFMTGFDKVIQFQVVRKTVEMLEVRLVARAKLTPAEENELRARVHERFDWAFGVRLVYVDEIPRTRGGKYLDYYSELKEDASV